MNYSTPNGLLEEKRPLGCCNWSRYRIITESNPQGLSRKPNLRVFTSSFRGGDWSGSYGISQNFSNEALASDFAFFTTLPFIFRLLKRMSCVSPVI